MSIFFMKLFNKEGHPIWLPPRPRGTSTRNLPGGDGWSPPLFWPGGTDYHLSSPLFAIVKRKIFVECPWDFHFLKQNIMIFDKCFSDYIIFVSHLEILSFSFLTVLSTIYDSKRASTPAINHRDEPIYRMRSYKKMAHKNVPNVHHVSNVFRRSLCVKSPRRGDKSLGDYFKPLEVTLFFIQTYG